MPPPGLAPTDRSYRFLLKWAVLFIVLSFIGHRAIQLWKSAPTESIHFAGIWLIPASLAYVVGWLPSVWFWMALLQSMRQPLKWRDAIRAHYVGQMGKYAPGKALVLVIRGSLVKDTGTNPLLAGVTAAYETLVFIAAGIALGLASAPIAFGDRFWSRIPIQLNWLRDRPILLPLLVFAATFATTPISSWLFTRIGRKILSRNCSDIGNLPAISASLISKGVIMTSMGWACHALSLGFVIQSVSTEPFDITQFPTWLAASTISMVGGFLVWFAPGGIGVREGLLIELLKDQQSVGPANAIVVAGLLRSVWFATELIFAAVLFFAKRKCAR